MRETIGRSKVNPVSKKPAYYKKHSFIPLQLSLLLFLFLPIGTALASDGSVVVVDVIAPFNSVTLAPGDSAPIVINISVTGNQAGTATFEVYKDWTLSGGVFTGSNPEEFIVPPRAGGDPATALYTSGTVTVDAGQGTGTFTLAASVFDITNTNTTGAKLAAGSPSNYQVTVTPPSNSPPVASGQAVTTNEDTPVDITLQATDSDGDTLIYSIVAGPSNGSLSGAIPNLTYTPATDYNGPDSFTFMANDGQADSNTATVSITVDPVNDAPSFTSGGDVPVLEDSGAYSQAWATTISAGPTDELGQTLTFQVSNDNNGLFSVQPAVAANGTLTFTPADNTNGTATVTVALQDNGGTANGGVDTSAPQMFDITVTAVNDAPSFTAGITLINVNEGAGAQTVAGWATAISAGPNESAQTINFSVSVDNPSLFVVLPAVSSSSGDLTFTPSNGANGGAIVTVTLKDNGGTDNGGVDTSASVNVSIVVNNVSPTVSPIVVNPADLLSLSSAAVTTVANFSDPGTNDPHTAKWNWGDGTPETNGSIDKGASPWNITGSHTYTSTGVFLVTLTVQDDDSSQPVSVVYRYIVVYDPSAGFVTGGGWILSPEGACPVWAPNVVDKAHFGFVSKYQKGATVPTGNTEFQFQAAALNFHSTSYEWLVIAGAKAQYKGLGRIVLNGSTLPEEFGFMLTAIDGQVNGGGGVDKFRIKIWNEVTLEVVYDNQVGATDNSETAAPVTALGGGSVVIHSSKK